jgi:hypothetical protein
MDTSHQATTLAVEIRVNLLLEGGFVQITTADSNTESNRLLLGLASDILVYGNGGVDTTALAEERSDSSARSLWCDKNDIDVSWNLDLGKIFENWGEAMGEVQCLQ